jgi:biotin synthase-like enzyme
MTPYGATCWFLTVRKWDLMPNGVIRTPTSPKRNRIDRGRAGWYFRSMSRNLTYMRPERKKARRDGRAEISVQYDEMLSYAWDGCPWNCEYCSRGESQEWREFMSA